MASDFLEVLQKRHSIRKYTDEKIPEELLTKVLQAGLLSPSSKSIRPWEFIVVNDREMLDKISECREGSAKMLTGAQCAIVVLGDENLSDVWIEDCSIVMSNMHIMASSLGIGSCWIQIRLRESKDRKSSEEYLRECLGFPENYRVEAILSLGLPAVKTEKKELENLKVEKIHWEKF